MRRPWILGVAAVVAVAGVATVFVPKRGAPVLPHASSSASTPSLPIAPSVGGALARAPGRVHTYALGFDQQLVMRAPGAGAKPPADVRFGVSGKLAVAFVAHEDGGLRLYAKLKEPNVTMQSTEGAQTLARELASPFYMVVESNGSLRELYVDRSTSDVTRNVIRTIAGASQVTRGEGSAWEAKETDVTGEFVASYKRQPDGALTKTHDRYMRVATGKGLVAAGELGSVEASGSTHIADGADGAFAKRIDVDEQTHALLGDMMPDVRSHVHATLTEEEAHDEPALLGLFEAEQGNLEKITPYATGNAARLRRAADEQLAGGRSVKDIVADARTADGPGRADLQSRASARLRLHEEENATTFDRIRVAPANEAHFLIGALGGAKTAASENTLGRIVDAKDVDAGLRSQAAMSLAFAHEDLAAARDALSRGADDTDPQVRGSSLLALGRVAYSYGDADPAAAAEIGAQIAGRWGGAEGDDQREAILRALGNAGDPRVVPMVREALASGDDAFRAAAISALRLVPTIEADTLLDSTASTDIAAQVRAAAIDAMGYRNVTGHAATLGALLSQDSDDGVRVTIVRVVSAAYAKERTPALRDLLARAASSDASNDIRNMARAGLTGVK